MKSSSAVALVIATLLAGSSAFAPQHALVRRQLLEGSATTRFAKKFDTASWTSTLERSATEVNESAKTEIQDVSNDVPTKQVELSKEKQLLQQVKDAGIAGIISYASWEMAFWCISIPVVLFGYYEVTGHWPDLKNGEDVAKLSGEAFAFVNLARLAVPLRIGLALSTTPWIQKNVVDKFMKDKKDAD